MRWVRAAYVHPSALGSVDSGTFGRCLTTRPRCSAVLRGWIFPTSALAVRRRRLWPIARHLVHLVKVWAWLPALAAFSLGGGRGCCETAGPESCCEAGRCGRHGASRPLRRFRPPALHALAQRGDCVSQPTLPRAGSADEGPPSTGLKARARLPGAPRLLMPQGRPISSAAAGRLSRLRVSLAASASRLYRRKTALRGRVLRNPSTSSC